MDRRGGGLSGAHPTFEDVAHRLGFIGDAKAGVPRTAYRGAVTVVLGGSCRVWIVPVGGLGPRVGAPV